MARRADPGEDAAVIKEIRRKVGAEVELRVDANRKWTYEEAIKFGSLVKDCGLQYIEVYLLGPWGWGSYNSYSVSYHG